MMPDTEPADLRYSNGYERSWKPDCMGTLLRAYLIDGEWIDAELIDIAEGR